jgi:hypothetical protein
MATIPTPATWSGVVVTSAEMNSQVRDVATFLLNPPTCAVYHSTDQAVPSGSDTPLDFDTERWDTDGIHTGGSPSQLVLSTDGVWEVHACIEFAAASGGHRRLQIELDGLPIVRTKDIATSGTETQPLSVSTIVKVTAGQVLECVVYQSSGSPLNVLAISAVSPEFRCIWKGIG